jgi:hypothetical protein
VLVTLSASHIRRALLSAGAVQSADTTLLCAGDDACLNYPCSSFVAGPSALCVDLPYPAPPDSAAGRTCHCIVQPQDYPAGVYRYIYANDSVGCLAGTLLSSLKHRAIPLRPASRWLAGQVLTEDVADGNACAATPCNGDAICGDLPFPAPVAPGGRTCTCRNRSLYYSETRGCTAGKLAVGRSTTPCV